MGNDALRKEGAGSQDHQPNLTDTAKFARMLEGSSLGSDTSRRARLAGAQVLAEHSNGGLPWAEHASPWPDIAALHRDIALLFQAENEPEPSELWLRAALTRTMDGPTATRLAAVLEQRRATDEAVVWYLRAADRRDPVATGRLAVMCDLAGSQDVATLLLSIGRSQMIKGRLAQADELARVLAKVGRRRRAKLISNCTDDILFLVGCELLISGARDAATECYSAALAKNHTVAALVLYNLTMSTIPDEDPAVAEVQSLTDRLVRAIKTEPAEIVTALVPDERKQLRAGDELDALVGAAVDGDRDAMGRLLGTIRPLVVRYCRARVGRQERTSASADDVAQEVCFAVLTALPGYRDQGRPFLAFVYGIAAHKVAEAHRSAARNRSEPILEVPDTLAIGDEPEQRALSGDLANRMSSVLEMLPTKQRDIVVLTVLQGYSAKETAELVGSTPSAVRVAQHRALLRLRKLLSSEEMCE